MTDKNANTEIRKEFCPNCEAETPCTHEAELYVCDICGEDFAKYIVSRNCNVSDVSMTRDVLTDIKTPSSIENTNPDYYKQELARRDEQIAELTATTHSQAFRNAELSRFVWWVYQVYARNVQELTSGITEACTYKTEEKAEKGKYGLPIRCWEYIRYLEEYTAGIYNGTYLDNVTTPEPPEDALNKRIAELESELKIIDALRAERDRAREMVTRLIETGRLLCDYAILVSFDHPMGDGRMALNDKSAWDALVTEWQKERETC